MRWCAIILIMALAMTIATPPSLALSLDRDCQAAFGVLDICHEHTPALSTGGDMPCVHECPCRYLPGVSLPAALPEYPFFSGFLLPSRNERPPQF